MEKDSNVGVHDERAGIGLRFWLGRNISWTFEGGQTVNSEFKFYTSKLVNSLRRI